MIAMVSMTVVAVTVVTLTVTVVVMVRVRGLRPMRVQVGGHVLAHGLRGEVIRMVVVRGGVLRW